MYSKEEAIRQIGEDRWEEFDLFMMEKGQEYDEDGMEVYYDSDLQEFKATL